MNVQIVQIPLAQIDAGQRLRAIDPDYAAMIAASMEERGQDTPIDVRAADPKNPAAGYVLIAGGHRFDAAGQLGWETIAAKVFTGNALQARLLEIDENLCRRELSALDRATFLAERKTVYEQLNPETKHGGDRLSDQVANLATWSNRFSAEVAGKIGLSERSIQRAITRFSRIAPDVRALLATTRFADKGTELDALAKLDAAEQRAVVARLLADEAGNVGAALRIVRDVRPPSAEDEAEAKYAALARAWAKVPARKARLRFLRTLYQEDPTLFDVLLQQREDDLAAEGEEPGDQPDGDNVTPLPRRRGRAA